MADVNVSNLLAKTPLTIFQASVVYARSWDNHLYLVINDTVHGWVDLNPTTGNEATNNERRSAFAIGVAAQASGKKVYVQYWGYDPNWGSGAGHFDSVRLALDSF
jgi:hypothetical protein